MANEIDIRISTRIKNGNLAERNSVNQFFLNQATVGGPTPGEILVTTSGVNVNLSALTSPGLCLIQNLDATNWVEYGIWNGATFYPLGRVDPGTEWPIYLSPNLDEGQSGTADVNDLRIRAHTASCKVIVKAYEA